MQALPVTTQRAPAPASHLNVKLSPTLRVATKVGRGRYLSRLIPLLPHRAAAAPHLHLRDGKLGLSRSYLPLTPQSKPGESRCFRPVWLLEVVPEPPAISTWLGIALMRSQLSLGRLSLGSFPRLGKKLQQAQQEEVGRRRRSVFQPKLVNALGLRLRLQALPSGEPTIHTSLRKVLQEELIITA